MQNEMKKSSGYFDINPTTADTLQPLWDMHDIFYLKDLQQRKLFINEGICEESVSEIVQHIMQYNREDYDIDPDKRKPILLYISSNGGSVDAGFELIDVIESSKTPVYTINVGYQYSMAFLIGIAGHKRFATKNAKYLMHDGSSFVWDSGAKVQDQVRFQERVNDRVKDYVISHSNVTSEEYDGKFRVEWYMFSDEAKEKGFVDYIIGEDCTIDDIV